MFKSNKQSDPKKTWGKFLDFKRDGLTRLKKLKSVIENIKRPQEIKNFFIEHHRVIYNVFYDVFIQLDTVKFMKSKLAHEDIDLLIYILEKILIYLPERIEKKWQLNSLLFVFQKLLNYNNLHMIRVEGLRLFLIFYQILGENVIRMNPKIEIMYAALVPGLVGDLERYHNPLPHMSINYDDASNHIGVYPSTNEHFYPECNETASGSGVHFAFPSASSAASLPPEQKYFFCRRLLEYSISQCGKVFWKDFREKKHEKAFEFMLASFSCIYLPYIFPRLAVENRGDWRSYTIRNLISIYTPPNELPILVKYSDPNHYPIYTSQVNRINSSSAGGLSHLQLAVLQSIVIDWFTCHLLPADQKVATDLNGTQTLTSHSGTLTSGNIETASIHSSGKQTGLSSLSNRSMASASGGLVSSLFSSSASLPSAQPCEYDFDRLKQLIDTKPFYVDLIMNLFHQSFLLPYTSEYALTMKNVIKVYKQWIYREDLEPLPQFLNYPRQSSSTSLSSTSGDVFAGCMNLYRLFIFSSVNVFLLDVPQQLDAVLTEQVELCKRALNIYRFMVMKVEMDRIVWENLVQALIQITKNIIPSQRPPKDRLEDTLGGRLAAALVQTLVVTWIKANLNVALSNQLWDDLGELLSSLTSWEEVIKEWANTMSILTRVMSRYVFNINLNENILNDTKAKHRLRAAAVLDHSELSPNGKMATRAHRATPPTSLDTKATTTPARSNDGVQHRTFSSGSNSAASTPTTSHALSSRGGVPALEHLSRKQSKVDVQRNTLLLLATSQMPVEFHQLFHRNSSMGMLVRSESDGCLVTSVSNSNCGIKLGARQSVRRGSKASRASRTNESSCKLSRNMPMIDDEVDDDGDSCQVNLNDDRDSLLLEDIQCNRDLMAHFHVLGVHRARSLTDLKHKPLSRLRTGTISLYQDESCLANPETISLGTNSLKDIPLGALVFDSTSSTGGSVHEHMNISASSRSGSELANSTHSLPVMLGGSHTGWSTEISVILWRRMLGILGDITTIPYPALNKIAIDCLTKIVEDFSKLIEMMDFNFTGETSLLLPSMHWFVAWLFKTALELGDEFREAKLSAYKLLCVIAIHRTSEQNITPDFLALFYLTIKKAFFNYYQIVERQQSNLQYQPEFIEAQRLVNIIIKYCGSKFFVSPLAGSSCLLNDFLHAASAIINEVDTKHPRVEALHLLGQLIGFFDIYKNVYILKSSVPRPELTPYQDLKEGVLQILISASKREPTGLGRSISLCSLGIFLYKEFLSRSENHRIKEVVNILIAGTKVSIKHQDRASSPSGNQHNDNATKFNNRILSRVACDMLRLQADHAAYLVEKYDGDIPARIIKGLCYTLLLHLEVVHQLKVHKDFKHLLLSLMFTLAHWCMSVPKEYLNNTMLVVDFLPTNGAADEPRDQTISLMSLALYVFNAIANLNISALVFDPSLEGVASFGEMDTIDYTILEQQFNPARLGLDTLRRSASPTRKSVFVTNDVWQEANTVKRAAQLILLHFHNFMGHFPCPQLKSQSLCALINENDENVHLQSNPANDKVDLEALSAPNVLVFVISDSCLMSFVELPPNNFDSTFMSKLNPKATSLNRLESIRVIIRNLLGKFAWDCAMLNGAGQNCVRKEAVVHDQQISHLENGTNSFETDSDNDDEEGDGFLQSTKKDNFELMLNDIVTANPECRLPADSKFMRELSLLPEAVDIVALFTNQHFQESSFNRQYRKKQAQAKMPALRAKPVSNRSSGMDFDMPPSSLDPTTAFQYCRQLIDQLGFLSAEKRSSIHLLATNANTIRELRHLDGQRCRETHKIAVIYVGPGQETKEAILLNKVGSRAFEEFVTRLGWEVNLAKHIGFMGGLESNLSTGLSAPYYADSFNEIIFHVSTRLEPAVKETPTETTSAISQQQLMTKKMRHLGNDEIHIVWSEHYKDYKRNIMATDFCDALIVIYPLPATTFPNLFRIVISRKPDVAFFGPLFNGAVVHRDELPALVRATALNASRAKRQNISALKLFFEERHDTIHALATKYKEKSTFEQFATRIYAPRYDKLPASTDPRRSITSGLVDLDTFVHNLNPHLKAMKSPCSAPVVMALDAISLNSSNSLDTGGPPSMSSSHSNPSSQQPAMPTCTGSGALHPAYPVQPGSIKASSSASSSLARPISRNSVGNR